MTAKEMKAEMNRLHQEIENNKNRDLENIINKLYNHPIAQNDRHYDFLKEIEKDLREYKKNYDL